MTEAATWAAEGAPHGAVVTADAQQAGRGRHGRSWTADPGDSLLATLILRPDLPASRLGLVPLAAGLAVADAVADFGVEARIKWPNDVRVGDRKLAGLLAEASWASDAPVVLLGIGLNVGQMTFPDELAASAVSLRQITGRPLDPLDVLPPVLDRLAAHLVAIERSPRSLIGALEDRLDGRGTTVMVWDPSTRRAVATGRIDGLAPDGGLQLATSAGLQTVHGGEVTLSAP